MFFKKEGYALIELLITFFILMLFFTVLIVSIPNFFNKLNTNFFAIQVYNDLANARDLALSLDKDATCMITPTSFKIYLDSELVKEIKIPLSIKVSSTANIIGFKGASGFTKFAGTITFSFKNYVKTISLGVGFGKLTLK